MTCSSQVILYLECSASRELISELPSLAKGQGNNIRGCDKYAGAGEDKEEAHERCEEQGCACAMGGAEEVR
ncbi:MAG: hypothetical protein PHH85_06040 [Candidatus Methanoperedens sp.]|nr:hypothetical protein [Candidatus Methanoperedens sp.]